MFCSGTLVGFSILGAEIEKIKIWLDYSPKSPFGYTDNGIEPPISFMFFMIMPYFLHPASGSGFGPGWFCDCRKQGIGNVAQYILETPEFLLFVSERVIEFGRFGIVCFCRFDLLAALLYT